MNCSCSTNVSEFLAGISLLCLGIHAGIVYFMRPKGLSVRFDPIWNSMQSKSPHVFVRNTESDSEENQSGDMANPDTNGDGDETNKDTGKGFYSYFT